MEISVYITSYNQKEYLKEAIDSVLNQTLLPFEIIIVDDASTDGSQELIKEYISKYPNLIRSHFNSVNLGITKSRNKALELVKGNYITGLDGDDAYLPRKLEVQRDLIYKTGATLAYTNFFYAEDKLDNLVRIWCSHIQQLPKVENIFNQVLSRSFPQDTLFRGELFKKELIEQVGLYDENLLIYEDYEFRIRLSKVAKVASTIEPLNIYRLHKEGLSRKPKELHVKSIRYIYNKHTLDIEKLNQQTKEKVLNFLKTLEETPITSIKKQPSLLKKVLIKIINKIP